MENNIIKDIFCSLEDHKEKKAIKECENCDIKLCQECSKFHSKYLPLHNLILINNEKSFYSKINCSQENHNKIPLNYYCQNHNELCCAFCLCIKEENNLGNHNKCKIISINEIENIKKQNLNENVKILNELIKKLCEKKQMIENILNEQEKNKEEIKKKISEYFTELRNILNEREDELFKIIDEKYDKEKISNKELKNIDNITKESNYLLKLGNEMMQLWDNTKIIEMVKKSINIEKMNEKINNFIKILDDNNCNNTFHFSPSENEFLNYKQNLKNFGCICKPFSFKLCPKDLNSYKVSGNNRNIVTKTDNQYVGAIIDSTLEPNSITKWTIKILSKQIPHICLGVAPYDFNLYMKNPYTFGWTLHINSTIYSPTIYSGPPHNYQGKNSSLSCYNYDKCNEVGIIMNTKEGSLSFILNKEKPIKCFENIPLDKPLSPVVYFDNPNESMEILLNYVIKL